MYAMGINAYLHDTSVALIKDGLVIFAAAEERFSRFKRDARFPSLAIGAALKYAGIGFRDLDAVAFGWNRGGVTPLHTLRAVVTHRLSASPGFVVGNVIAMAHEIYYGNGRRNLEQRFGSVAAKQLFYVDHHLAHAWSAYALSGFDEALVVVMDGRGATQATTLYHGCGNRLRPFRTIQWPNSLGVFYEAFTDLLGFERHNDEWKVMGLAAYGQPTYDLSDILQVHPGGYHVNTKLICGRWWNDISYLIQRFGPRRNPEHITDTDCNLAASVQNALEQAIFAVVAEGVRVTGSRNLCLAGGVAMNAKANGRLLSSGLINSIFVQPAATDDGTAIGAALTAYGALTGVVPRYRLPHVYLGPEYLNEEIETVLRTYKLARMYVPRVEELTARLLADSFIVGWFQGRMEFGPRALGNRSILADPRRLNMKDRVNDSIKFRENWRPFAPSCLADRADEYFEGFCEAPYMTLTFTVRPEKRSEIPAVTHIDNSARIQTVSQTGNPRYWRLIRTFAGLTGVPVLLNTSFNLRGEPIVCTPRDAIRTFYSSGLDFLVLGDFIIAKDSSWQLAAAQATAGTP
jgi:carbamoyltransferase